MVGCSLVAPSNEVVSHAWISPLSRVSDPTRIGLGLNVVEEGDGSGVDTMRFQVDLGVVSSNRCTSEIACGNAVGRRGVRPKRLLSRHQYSSSSMLENKVGSKCSMSIRCQGYH